MSSAADLIARPMRVSDLDWVSREESLIYPFPWSKGNFSDSLKAGYDAWVFSLGESDPQGRAPLHAHPIAYAVMMWIPDEMHLLNLSVLQRSQGQGLGRRVLHWLCSDGLRRHSRRVLLEVRPSNHRARQLYETSGFRTVGIRKRYYPAPDLTREDAIVMALEIGQGVE
jgi:ribosomal-protein-alanine N-acetyltransferase